MRISATLGGEWNASGSIYIRNICFSPADKDLKTQAILSPSGNAIAASSDDHTVKVRYSNPSPMAIENPTFCYDAGYGVVREVYQGVVEAGKSVDYSFLETYSCDEVGLKSIAVWCEVEGDSEHSNDTISKVLNYYEPLSFPYVTTFEEGNALWNILDENGDGQSFVFYALNPSDSCVAFENYACLDIYDVLMSPAVKIPAGKHRIVFNYAGYNKKGSVNLKLYMGTTPDYSQMTEVLFDRDLINAVWETGYHLLDIKQEGIYYFAFVAQGAKDAVLIDNLKVDDGEDLGISDIRFSTITGYNLSTADVIISYVNYGVTAQQDVKLSYMTNDEFTKVEEVNPAVIEPGDTIHYTFSVPDKGYGREFKRNVVNRFNLTLKNDEKRKEFDTHTIWMAADTVFAITVNNKETGKVVLPEGKPSAKGYTFAGWTLDADSLYRKEGALFADNNTKVSDKDSIYHAVFSYNGVMVHFDEPSGEIWGFSARNAIDAKDTTYISNLNRRELFDVTLTKSYKYNGDLFVKGITYTPRDGVTIESVSFTQEGTASVVWCNGGYNSSDTIKESQLPLQVVAKSDKEGKLKGGEFTIKISDESLFFQPYYLNINYKDTKSYVIL